VGKTVAELVGVQMRYPGLFPPSLEHLEDSGISQPPFPTQPQPGLVCRKVPCPGADVTVQGTDGFSPEWNEVIDTNLSGSFWCIQAVLQGMMRARWGRIVNIASVVGQSGNPGQANYVAAKAGLIGLTKSMALEIASRNVTVNAVSPGFIQTSMTEGLDERVKEKILGAVPLKRMGTAEEVAYAVRFLASDEAAYITGHVLNVNGGLYQ
jgi:NAD(P)-dependent dehydrogenase (short-subunit alcohol dehydrogenase family)